MGGLEWWSAGVLGCWVYGIKPLLHHSITPTRICSLRFRGFDVFDLNVEVQSLAGQRMIQVDDNGFVLHLMHSHGDGSAVGSFAHQHGARLLPLRGDLVARDLLKSTLVRQAVTSFRRPAHIFLV